MNKFIHALVLTVFSVACWFSWAIITLAPHVKRNTAELPRFTELCVSLRPFIAVLPLLALAYCIWVWTRKPDKAPSWVSFFAVAMSVLVLVTPPAMVAAYLPLLDAVNQLGGK